MTDPQTVNSDVLAEVLAAKRRLCTRRPDQCPESKRQQRAAASSQIGDCLQQRLQALAIHGSLGCGCQAMAERLNRSTPEQVREQLDSIVQEIAARIPALTGLGGHLVRAVATVVPSSLTAAAIRKLIVGCLQQAPNRSNTMSQ